MTWYAVRTAPGSQMPQREYAVETTTLNSSGNPRGKGYRIVPSLDPRQSAVEKALSDAGFVHYMPAEKRLIRDRRHTDLWKPRRFALLVGYVFIHGEGDVDWLTLSEVPGVAGIVGIRGKPMPIALADILMLRSMEAVGEEKFDRDAKLARSIIKGKAKRDPRLQKLVNKLQGQDVATVPLTSLLAA